MSHLVTISSCVVPSGSTEPSMHPYRPAPPPLTSQAYGARSYKTLGLVLQRALLICWAICIPISLLWTHSEKLLLLLGQKPSIAAGAAL